MTTATGSPTGTDDVWDVLIGQGRAVARLRDAVRDAQKVLDGGHGPAMTHAWLFTGPPGSGRSNAAMAFAAALQCEFGGCGHCHECRTALEGSHADVTVLRPDGAHHRVDAIRELVMEASRRPARGRWRVMVIEDADRMRGTNERWAPANALLRAIEEPTPRTVWLLCAPGTEDVLPTIRSRCRSVALTTPTVAAVTRLLVADGVDPGMASFAAAASQGHIGRARGLARDEDSRLRRADVLRVPLQVESVGGAMSAAAALVDTAQRDAAEFSDARDATETDDLKAALGVSVGRGGRRPSGTAGALKDLEDSQKRRRTRTVRDSLDRAFLDLVSFYRDVLTVQLGTGAALVNADVRGDVERVARAGPPEATIHRIDAIFAAREAVAANVTPLLAVEAMTLTLRSP
jgi:DNA polymerase-3 subunit delta'